MVINYKISIIYEDTSKTKNYILKITFLIIDDDIGFNVLSQFIIFVIIL